MNLVETHVKSYTSILCDGEARREAKRRAEWEDTISRHHRIMVERLGTRLCAEIELDVPSYDERGYAFHCRIFDHPCSLTVHKPYQSQSATLKFSANIDGRDVYSPLPPDDPIGQALYTLKAKMGKILRPSTLQERVWYPYYYYELTYAVAYQDDDGSHADVDIVNVMRGTPDENGWYHVLNPRYYPGDKRTSVRLEKFTNIVKIAKLLAEKPTCRRDNSTLIKDEETGKSFDVLVPIEGVERV